MDLNEFKQDFKIYVEKAHLLKNEGKTKEALNFYNKAILCLKNLIKFDDNEYNKPVYEFKIKETQNNIKSLMGKSIGENENISIDDNKLNDFLFKRYNKFADSYKEINPDIYFFLKECGFKRIFRENNYKFPNIEIEKMFISFKSEKDNQLPIHQISKDEYKNFLENIFKRINFNNSDLLTFQILKIMIENLGIFGNFDALTAKRIIYFNNKIKKLKESSSVNELKYSNLFEIMDNDLKEAKYILNELNKKNSNEDIKKGNPFAVNFILVEKNIHYPIVCYNSDNFSKLEEQLFTEFPEIKNKNIYYLANGSTVDTSATVEENKFKHGTNIIINFVD